MKLPRDLVERITGGAPGTTVAYLATALGDGRPNLLPVPFTDVVGDELVLLPDLFAQKTKVNLNENSAAALSFASEGDQPGWVLEGHADIVQWGHPRAFKAFGLSAASVLERWGDWDEGVEPVIDAEEPAARPTVFAQRGVIVFKPERISEVSS
jgi:predicted pyridoxine 5'-phosphate oxidase superfamily flavin-nucleotide-binding protein